MTYWLFATFFGVYARAVFGARVVGRDHLPAGGGAVFCGNHRSWWDIPVVGSLLGRRVHFMAKEELFRYPVFGALIRKLGAFPVQRGEADRRALRTAIALVSAGEVVAIFPEGHRNPAGTLGTARAGAAFVASRAGVPIVPIGITGAYRRGGATQLRVGQPFEVVGPDGRPPRAAELDGISQTVIMARIAALLDQPNRGADGAVRAG